MGNLDGNNLFTLLTLVVTYNTFYPTFALCARFLLAVTFGLFTRHNHFVKQTPRIGVGICKQIMVDSDEQSLKVIFACT